MVVKHTYPSAAKSSINCSFDQQKLSWQQLLAAEKTKPYFRQILQHIKQQRSQGTVIYPPQKQLFTAFELTPAKDVKVVILGQDPYHGAKQAHGLAFSVPPELAIPPSLRNIFNELHSDLKIPIPQHGCLKQWARQGVLLLNTTLSVVAQQPASHSKLGWSRFTDHVIQQINQHQRHVVFLLWGAHAIRKQALIDNDRHSVLTAPHPSPLSAHRGFIGCKHFSRCNHLLELQQLQPIDWGAINES